MNQRRTATRAMRAVMSMVCLLLCVVLASHPVFATESGQNGTYTAEQVAANSTVSKCWTIIEGAVYDLTEWIRQHPGGEAAIAGLCGKDGSPTFSGKHQGESRPATALKRYLVGFLSNTTKPTPTASPSVTTAPSKLITTKRTISCVKGKVIRRVTAVNPKCPNGFRRR